VTPAHDPTRPDSLTAAEPGWKYHAYTFTASGDSVTAIEAMSVMTASP
jgi:hypothetical protein